jgi:hypothetical protein
MTNKTKETGDGRQETGSRRLEEQKSRKFNCVNGERWGRKTKETGDGWQETGGAERPRKQDTGNRRLGKP